MTPELQKFQRLCAVIEHKRMEDELTKEALKDIEERKWEQMMEEWYLLKEAQDRFGDRYKPITVLGGFKKSKCPCCKATLDYSHFVADDRLWDYMILVCTGCGYRWAHAQRNAND